MPARLSRATIEEFARLVSNSATHPLFVYDANGSLSGPLWYLYFRKVERLSDDAARIRADRLGLREPTDADTYPASPLGLPPPERFGEFGRQRFRDGPRIGQRHRVG